MARRVCCASMGSVVSGMLLMALWENSVSESETGHLGRPRIDKRGSSAIENVYNASVW
ncbi:hypothetical protein BU25DRAFT_407096 [Macroventuria anomochaeta]|uniref:Uncharacterized protein n=1 Tax=Macroventuria anomochaeta TaxID=301207 RepID=A0ACB6SAZ5_9PLEO|nr:uncharacterized protein BU25DRAFT_407096 [Macroventuria anomochaeta]KAF2631445.1 hypothetical protein BU25DRAFT_407096 [Macroventuria anomochaeta]